VCAGVRLRVHAPDVGAMRRRGGRGAVLRKLVVQFLAAGNDPDLGWSLIARMLAEVVAGKTATLDKLTGLGALASTSEDPQVRAGKNASVDCSEFGPQRDYAALPIAVDAEEVVRGHLAKLCLSLRI
jgi:hypothetical protein